MVIFIMTWLSKNQGLKTDLSICARIIKLKLIKRIQKFADQCQRTSLRITSLRITYTINITIKNKFS